jgi:hypothetical protein
MNKIQSKSSLENQMVFSRLFCWKEPNDCTISFKWFHVCGKA